MNRYGFTLNPAKSTLFVLNVKWYGRMIDADGIKEDVSRIQALLDIPEPQNADELQRFLCPVGWMCTAIPDYARIAKTLLQDKLEQALTGKTKKKITAAGIAIQLNQDESRCLTAIKDVLANSATTAFPEENAIMCVFTDASHHGWGTIVTQIDKWDDKKAIENQDHELVICTSGMCDFKMGKQIIRYLNRTSEYRLNVTKTIEGPDLHFEVYTDADWASESDDSKSVNAAMTFMNGMIIS
jgi:hypothetical protein